MTLGPCAASNDLRHHLLPMMTIGILCATSDDAESPSSNTAMTLNTLVLPVMTLNILRANSNKLGIISCQR